MFVFDLKSNKSVGPDRLLGIYTGIIALEKHSIIFIYSISSYQLTYLVPSSVLDFGDMAMNKIDKNL